MFKNYIKIVFRRIRRHKLNTSINLVGLSVGIAAAIIMVLYARNELTFDHFHEKADRIYLVYKERITPTGTQITRDTWLPMAESLKKSYQAIDNTVRVWDSGQWVEGNNQKFEEQITYADPSLFDVFTFPLASGDRQSLSADIHSAVISQKVARKFFGDSDAIGKRIRIAFQTDYIVRGVLADVPQNSTLNIDILISPLSIPSYEQNADNWRSAWIYTFLQLHDGASPAELERQLPDFVTRVWGDEENQRTNMKLMGLKSLHNDLTHANTRATILLIIAFIILAIASINFMNLTTARSLERAQEIGLRKVMGAGRRRLIWQFLGESVSISLLAMVLAVLMVELVLPLFNQAYGISLELSYFENRFTIMALIGLAIGVGAIAGIYPAFHLSRFQPADTLRGQFDSAPSGLRLRLGLVVAQFTLSIILIIATSLLWQQIQFMKTADLHFDKDKVLVVKARQSDFADQEHAKQILESFKDELRQHSGVISVSSSSNIPGLWPDAFTFVFPVDQGEERRLRMRWCNVDAHYFETFGIQYQEGRGFSEELPAEAAQSVVVNEAAMHDLGWLTASGHQLRIGDTKYNILGVVKDYHYSSLEEEIAPVVHFYQPADSRRHRMVAIKLAAGGTPAALDFIREKWQQLVPDSDMDFFFVDENFNLLYQTGERLLKVATVFAGLAITIAALGLFALSSLMVVKRTREIGIRKVLGATAANVVGLLTKNFVRLILIANLIAWPVAWYAMNKLLQNFAYRIEIGWWVFVLAGGLTLLISLLTVSMQAIRAALANPVDSLRYE